MPKGTKVDDLFQKLKNKGLPIGEAAAIAQTQTNQSLHTGKHIIIKKVRKARKNRNSINVKCKRS